MWAYELFYISKYKIYSLLCRIKRKWPKYKTKKRPVESTADGRVVLRWSWAKRLTFDPHEDDPEPPSQPADDSAPTKGYKPPQTLPRTRKWSGLAHPERRGYEDDAVSTDKQHGDVPLGRLKTHTNTRFYYRIHGQSKISNVSFSSSSSFMLLPGTFVLPVGLHTKLRRTVKLRIRFWCICEYMTPWNW